MNSLIKLVSDPWFLVTVFVSVIGALVVLWGLKIGGDAEKLLPPTDFKEDIFGDIIKQYKAKMDFGHEIIMAGVAIEAVCALAVCVISGLENAELNQKAGDAWSLAENIGTTNAQLSLRIEGLRSNNLALEKEVIGLRNPSKITTEQREKFIEILCEPRNTSKVPIIVICGGYDRSTEQFAFQIQKILDEAGYEFVPSKYQSSFLPLPTNSIYVTDKLVHIDLPPFEWMDETLIKLKSGSVSPMPEISNSNIVNFGAVANTEYPFTDREPNIIAIFSGNVPSNNIIPSVNVAYPTPFNPSRGYSYMYAPTKDPNAILYGVCEVFHDLGITVGRNKATGILPDGYVGLFIPSR